MIRVKQIGQKKIDYPTLFQIYTPRVTFKTQKILQYAVTYVFHNELLHSHFLFEVLRQNNIFGMKYFEDKKCL